jgi:hypothetical protein
LRVAGNFPRFNSGIIISRIARIRKFYFRVLFGKSAKVGVAKDEYEKRAADVCTDWKWLGHYSEMGLDTSGKPDR